MVGGSSETGARKDRMDPPEPSVQRAAPRAAQPGAPAAAPVRAPVSMAAYNNCNNPCFSGDSLVQMQNRSKAYKAGINTDESRRRRELVQRCVPASARQQHAAASPAQRTLADRNNHTISAEEHDGAAHEADAAHEHKEMECPVCMEAINEADAAMRCRGIGGHRHYFHSQCLTRWAETIEGNWSTATCPVCRGGVEETTVQLRRMLLCDRIMSEV